MVEYTIDDIRGPTVAREMAQLKEFVLAQFNGAIADAEAAAAAAAQAVLDSLDARVGALEGDMTTVQGAILTLDGAVVKLAGTQTITGAKTFSLSPTVPAPTNATDAANKKYVDDALDAYAPMVRTTGNQGPIAGTKTFSGLIEVARSGIQAGINLKRTDITAGSETSNKGVTYIQWLDSVGNQLGFINATLLPNGTSRISISVRNSDGTPKDLILLSGDVI